MALDRKVFLTALVLFAGGCGGDGDCGGDSGDQQCDEGGQESGTAESAPAGTAEN